MIIKTFAGSDDGILAEFEIGGQRHMLYKTDFEEFTGNGKQWDLSVYADGNEITPVMANKDNAQFTFFSYDTKARTVCYNKSFIGAVSCMVYKNSAILLLADDCDYTTWDEERCFELSYAVLSLKNSYRRDYNFCKKYSGDISKADCTLKIENDMIYCALNNTTVPVEDVIGCSYKDANYWYHQKPKTDQGFTGEPIILVKKNTLYSIKGRREHICFSDVDFGVGYLKYKLLFRTLTNAMQRRVDIAFEDAITLFCEQYSQTRPELKALVENVIRICGEAFDADDRSIKIELLKRAIAEYGKLLEIVSERKNKKDFFTGVEIFVGMKEIKQFIKDRYLEALAAVDNIPDNEYNKLDLTNHLSCIDEFVIYKDI